MLPKVIIAVSMLFFCLQSQQAHYRWRLFHDQYASVPFSNHVGDDSFILLHTFNIIALLGCCLSTFGVWRSGLPWRLAGMGCAFANVLVWGVFAFMHRTGVLVTYIEFIQHMKGMR